MTKRIYSSKPASLNCPIDGGQVSEVLLKVSYGLDFHLFVIGTVIFASVFLCQVKKFFIPSKENVGATQQTVYICKRLTLNKYAATCSITHITIYNSEY